MKKSIIFSVVAASMILFQTIAVSAAAGRGHKAYAKHQKHHKVHKLHQSHGMIDATYR
jgi:Spy/CpxP family protein refolding chaperone